MRRCSRCERQLPNESFSRSSKARDGLHSYCKQCMAEYAHAKRSRMVLPERACPTCRVGFVPRTRKAVYCSPNCKQRALYRRATAEQRAGRTCLVCGTSIEHMRLDAKWCSVACSNRRPVSAGIRRRSRLRTEYGLTPEQMADMLATQGDACAICGAQNGGRWWAVDHDHETGRVRGILCEACNLGLGKLGDTAAALRRALEYLEGVE